MGDNKHPRSRIDIGEERLKELVKKRKEFVRDRPVNSPGGPEVPSMPPDSREPETQRK